MKVYLSSPTTDYGGPRQAQAIDLIKARGWEVERPDLPHHEEAYRVMGMKYFADLVYTCDALVFIPYEADGAVGAGVAKEILEALVHGKPVYRFNGPWLTAWGAMPAKILTIEETRARRKAA